MSSLFGGWWQNKPDFDAVNDAGYVHPVDEDRHTILIIGRSKAGKSTLQRYLMRKYLKPGRTAYSLNDRTLFDPYVKTDWTKVKSLERSGIVVEDVYRCSQQQFESLQELLNFSNHHRLLDPIVVITHSLSKTGLQSLLPFFSQIYISGLMTSLPSLKTILNIFGFEDDEKAAFVSKLKENKVKHAFFLIDLEERTMKLHEITDKDKMAVDAMAPKKIRPAPASDADILSSAKTFLGLLPESKKAIALFQMIQTKAPRIDASDLTVKMKELKKRGGGVEKEFRLSLIDYIQQLVSKDAPEDRRMRQFHDFLCGRGLKLPRAYVLNERFWN